MGMCSHFAFNHYCSSWAGGKIFYILYVNKYIFNFRFPPEAVTYNAYNAYCSIWAGGLLFIISSILINFRFPPRFVVTYNAYCSSR